METKLHSSESSLVCNGSQGGSSSSSSSSSNAKTWISYTKDGSLDRHGRPAAKGRTGGWRAGMLLLGNEVLATLAFVGVEVNLVLFSKSVLRQTNAEAANTFSMWMGAVYLFSLIGAFLSDSYLGRYFTCLIFQAVLTIGLIASSLTTQHLLLKPGGCGTLEQQCDPHSKFETAIFFISIYLVALGNGAAEPALATFGADQFDEEDPEESRAKTSFFSYFYVALNMGSLIGETILVYIETMGDWVLGFSKTFNLEMSLSLLFKPKFIPISLRFLPAISITFFSTLCNRKPHFNYPSIDPPFPKKLPFKVTVHGRSWNDPYHWMSNINDPDFVNFLSQENSYAEAFMADTRVFQRKLFSEMCSRIPAKISTPPERWGPWLYYQHIPEGKEYPILCRRLDTEESTGLGSLFSIIKQGFKREEILLDWNEIAKKYGYVHVGACRVSPDHNFLAYTLDKNGSEQFTLQVKDLRYGHIISSVKADAVVSLAWAQDGSALFYTVADDNQRPYRVFCTYLGSNEEKIVFTERDSRFCVDITCSKDGKFVTINSNSRSSSEVYVIDAANPFDSLHRVHKRVHGVQYFLEHHRGFFYVLTNHPSVEVEKLHCGNFYLGICRVEDINSADWQNIILPKKGTSLQDMDVFDKNLVLYYDKEGSSMICSVNLPIDVNNKRIVEIEDLNPWTFPIPSELCTMAPGSNHDYMASVYRVLLSSPVMPDLVVEYDLSTRSFNVVHQEEVSYATESALADSSKFGIDGEPLSNIRNDKCKRQEVEKSHSWNEFSVNYASEIHEVISHDGTKIPLTIVYSKDMHHKGQSPGILEAYGAYGEVLDKSWSSDRLSLLDCGWVVAFADVRGGGGPDPSWHQYGSGANKINSIYDLVSCGKYLVNEGYATKGRLAAIGTSAGSLLVGAAINFHPDLFCAVILKVPFLDVCNTLMDDSLPLTILDYDEFGNPKIESQFEKIMEYSPYDNINKGLCYPSMLVTAAFNDSRVGVWEAAKWVAKVREETCTSCSRAVILKTEMYGGHFGEGGRFGQSEEKAYEYAFLIKVMGLLDNSKR